MLNRVLLARHGETEWNVAGRRQGRLDSPLTAVGQQDAAEMAMMLDGVGCTSVFSSPLGRAFTTASVVADHLGLDVVVIDELAEVDHGSFAGLTNAEIESQYPNALADREQNKYDWRFPDGESYADADVRISRALARVADLVGGHEVALPLIVSHAMVGRSLLRVLLGLGVDSALAFAFAHRTIVDVRPSGDPGMRVLTTSA